MFFHILIEIMVLGKVYEVGGVQQMHKNKTSCHPISHGCLTFEIPPSLNLFTNVIILQEPIPREALIESAKSTILLGHACT